MREYKAITQQTYKNGEFKLVPIRHEDRYDIMRWRNEQVYHLRQIEPLTIEKQEHYFNTTIAQLFTQDKPNQILFSLLKGEDCVGYGGLVHINWIDKHAELSFLISTELEKESFKFLWSKFLALIEIVAFEELMLHKIFTYAFDLRPHLYRALEGNGFKREAVLKEHCLVENQYRDVVLHSLLNKRINLRKADIRDVNLTYGWAINSAVRRFSLNKCEIKQGDHSIWFDAKLNDPNCLYFIAEKQNDPIGSLRLDIGLSGSGYISYLIDPKYHGKGYGSELLRLGVRVAKEKATIKTIVADVLIENKASVKVFENLGFSIIEKTRNLIRYKLNTE